MLKIPLPLSFFLIIQNSASKEKGAGFVQPQAAGGNGLFPMLTIEKCNKKSHTLRRGLNWNPLPVDLSMGNDAGNDELQCLAGGMRLYCWLDWILGGNRAAMKL